MSGPNQAEKQAFHQDLKVGVQIFIRPDSAPRGRHEAHASCFSAVMSEMVSKDFQICLKKSLYKVIHINFLWKMAIHRTTGLPPTIPAKSCWDTWPKSQTPPSPQNNVGDFRILWAKRPKNTILQHCKWGEGENTYSVPTLLSGIVAYILLKNHSM